MIFICLSGFFFFFFFSLLSHSDAEKYRCFFTFGGKKVSDIHKVKWMKMEDRVKVENCLGDKTRVTRVWVAQERKEKKRVGGRVTTKKLTAKMRPRQTTWLSCWYFCYFTRLTRVDHKLLFFCIRLLFNDVRHLSIFFSIEMWAVDVILWLFYATSSHTHYTNAGSSTALWNGWQFIYQARSDKKLPFMYMF